MGIHIQVHAFISWWGLSFDFHCFFTELIIFSIYPTHSILTKFLKTLYILDTFIKSFLSFTKYTRSNYYIFVEAFGPHSQCLQNLSHTT